VIYQKEDYVMRLLLVSVVGATLAFAGLGAAIAQPSVAVQEDSAQLKSDIASLQRQVERLKAAEATLTANTASGRMSATSKDEKKDYDDRQFIQGEKKDIAADVVPGSLQMKVDKAALQRALRRMEADEAALKSDTASGRMSAESKDAFKVYTDLRAVKGEKTDIATDKAKLQADQKK
jgi:cell division protein FtsB